MTEQKLTKPNLGDQKIIEKLQLLLGKKLEQVPKIKWGTRGYTVNQAGAVVGLGLYDFGIDDKKLKDLTETLTSLTSLTTLYLCSNKLTDISALKELPNLTRLNLSSNKLTDISVLKALSSLTQLYLSSNKLTDISVLQELPNLTRLNLSSNQLTDISVLKALSSLTQLDLSRNNKLTDISVLKELPNLTQLDLSGNELTDISVLKELPNLTRLELSYNKLTDISVLKKLPNLTRLYLSYNQLTDISALQKLPNLTQLDLSYNQLTDISVLQELPNLTRLYLRYNQLADISVLKELPNLTRLDLRGNQLTDISVLKELPNLTRLVLSSNPLTDISVLKELPNLTRLDLSSNPLTNISVLQELPNLTQSDLRNNQLTDISVLKELPNLTRLDLRDNKLKNIPAEFFEKDWKIHWEDDYISSGLNLYGNPLETPPVEIVKQGREAIQRYFRQLRESDAKTQKDHYLFEAKLLIIGEAGAGKTTFARKLKDPNAEMPKPEDTTRGIDVHTWSFEITGDDFPKLKNLNIDKTMFYLNLWDFGGQEIYHGTHQFFFSEDSLYVLLGDTREQKTDFNYWLLTTEQLAGNSPLIIVLNKREGHEWRIDQTGLMSRYGEIIKDIKTVDLSRPQEIPELQRSIKYRLSSLPMIGDKLPGSWVEIREKLSKEKKEFIAYGMFQAICKESGISDIEDVKILSRYYDKIGVITHFIDDPVLQERVYIDSNWLVKTIYHLLDDKDVKKQDGRLTKRQIEGIWKDNEIYQEVDKLVQLMLRFGLLFKVKDKDSYIVPEHLKKEKPYERWPYEDGEILEFHYELGKYMPKGLMAQLIVELHHHIKEYELAWWRGVNVEYNSAKAEVIETYGQQNKFVIRVSGKNRRDLLVIIREHFERIIGKFKKLEPNKLVPCNCDICKESADPKFHLWDELQNLANKNISGIPCGKSGLDVDIHKLLGEYGTVKKEERERSGRGGGDTYNYFYHDHVEGSKSEVVAKSVANIERYNQMTQEKVINIGNGNTINAPVVVADQIENSFNIVAESDIKGELKELLHNLINEVNEAAKAVPEETAESMARDVESLSKEVVSSKPRRKWYEMSIEGLKDAAQAVGEVGKPILKTVSTLLPMLNGIFG